MTRNSVGLTFTFALVFEYTDLLTPSLFSMCLRIGVQIIEEVAQVSVTIVGHFYIAANRLQIVF